METYREFSTTTPNGKELKIVATYVSKLTINPLISDHPFHQRDYISTCGSMMVAYLDGKKIGDCWNPSFWGLIETNGAQKIWGLPIAFSDQSKADAYNAFLADLVQEDPEVIAFRAQKAMEEIAKEIEACKEVVRLCELGYLVETAAEVSAKREQWNNLQNEGGSGYVPTWYTRDEYNRALECIAQEAGKVETH